MHNYRNRLLMPLGLLIIVALISVSAQASAAPAGFPQKPIEAVYHTAAGGGGDIFLRLFSRAAEKALGQPVVVNNVVGGSGYNAWSYVSSAKNDGYTILGISPALVSGPLNNNMPISFRNFEPIALYFVDPIVYFVLDESPFKTMQDVIDYVKAHPGELKVAGGTAGATYQMAHVMFVNALGLNMPIVPYEGGGEQMAAVLGGHLPIGCGNFNDAAEHLELGTMRVLVTFNKMNEFPEIPDMTEIGHPGVIMEMFRGLAAPKGTDPEIIKFIAECYKTAYDDPEFKEYIKANYLVPTYKTGSDVIATFERYEQQLKDLKAQ